MNGEMYGFREGPLGSRTLLTDEDVNDEVG
jgi:hypothetical protein